MIALLPVLALAALICLTASVLMTPPDRSRLTGRRRDLDRLPPEVLARLRNPKE